jgi:putative Ca2+/H+ antiporter (TMEM165/GDT1 family)
MLADALVPFAAVALAELGDKTQLSILLLSSKTKKHAHLLLGVMLAFLVVDGAAVLAGTWALGIAPVNVIKPVSGAVFIAFGAMMLRGGTTGGTGASLKNPFVSGFTLIFLSEWGDKTQVAAALLATRYDALLVLAAVMTALMLLSAMAIYAGKSVVGRIDGRAVTKIAGAAFVLIGASFIITA